jgi:hypothetical protein
MKTIIYKCDRCGTEDTNNIIGLDTIYVGAGQYFSDARNRAHGVEWCKKCRIETGIIERVKSHPDIKSVDPEPTLEELIREIIREEIQCSQS